MATQMTSQESNSRPRNNTPSITSPVTFTGSDDSKKAETLAPNSTPSATPPINPKPISKPQPSTLESWAQAYDSKKSAKSRGILDLTSAFQRPTYTAAPLKRTSSSTGQGSASSSISPVIEFGHALTSKPIQSSPRNSKEDIMSGIEALIAECRKPPETKTPLTTTGSSNPLETNWIATSTFTLSQLDQCLHRLCSELNWDWYGTKYHTLNPNSTLALSKIWRTMVSSMYELYCVERARPERSVWKMLIHVERGEEEALNYFRRQVHNVMMFWVDAEGRGSEEGVIEVLTQEGKDKLRVFAETILSGGDILEFMREKARSVGLIYPAGTGRFEERIRMMTLAKERAKYERTCRDG